MKINLGFVFLIMFFMLGFSSSFMSTLSIVLLCSVFLRRCLTVILPEGGTVYASNQSLSLSSLEIVMFSSLCTRLRLDLSGTEGLVTGISIGKLDFFFKLYCFVFLLSFCIPSSAASATSVSILSPTVGRTLLSLQSKITSDYCSGFYLFCCICFGVGSSKSSIL